MREITRIHIAKIAYDIELDAKKELEDYISALERYANDPEILADIEIRITELLAERKIVDGGVIASDDVAAVRAQLGEPSEFAADEVEASEAGAAVLIDQPRRVYRDESNALVGGVLSGLGKFTGVDPLWMRLLFIVILLGSFGTALILYLVLWLIIPPARTAAERLQMSGEPVTLATLKDASRRATPVMSESMRVVRTMLRYGLGSLLLVGAVGALAGVAVAVGMPYGDGVVAENWKQFDEWWVPAAFGLFALAGLLLATLLTLLAVATLRKHWSGRITMAVAAFVVVGLVTFFGGVGTLWYGKGQFDMRINTLMQESQATSPSAMRTVKNLKVVRDDSTYGEVWVNYMVAETPRWELTAFSGHEPQFTFSENGDTATVKVVRKGGDEKALRQYRNAAAAILNIYGPELESFDAQYVDMSSYLNEDSQDKLQLVLRDTNFNLGAGGYSEVSLRAEGSARVSLLSATISKLAVDSEGGRVEAAVVRNLSVNHPEACASTAMPDGSQSAVVSLNAVTSGKLMYNGNERVAETIINDCGRVIIGEEDAAEAYEL